MVANILLTEQIGYIVSVIGTLFIPLSAKPKVSAHTNLSPSINANEMDEAPVFCMISFAAARPSAIVAA